MRKKCDSYVYLFCFLSIFCMLGMILENSTKSYHESSPLSKNLSKSSQILDINTSPSIETPGNTTFFIFDNTKDLMWRIFDDNYTAAANYTLFVNGTSDLEHTNQTWISGISITHSVADMLPGEFIVSLFANDGLGGIAQENITVTIEDNEDPHVTCNRGVLILLDEEYSGASFTLIWTITDDHVLDPNYSITCDGDYVGVHQDKPWTSGITITIETGYIIENEYTYIVYAFDGYGGETRFMVEIFWDQYGIVEDVVDEVVEDVVERLGFPGYPFGQLVLVSVAMFILIRRIFDKKPIIYSRNHSN